jgi:TolA-binding protein
MLVPRDPQQARPSLASLIFTSRSIFAIALLTLFVCKLHAQKTVPKGGISVPSSSAFPGADLTTRRPIYVSGRVLIEGGLVPTEPIAIERVCNGGLRREGYTDSKGQFQFQLGEQTEQDVSENDSASGSQQVMKSSGAFRVTRFEGCELRALLTGFRSTSVTLHILQDDFGETRVGTIVLSRLSSAEGSSISVTSLSAQKEARQAYEAGRKAAIDKKFDEAARQLNEAVRLYPKYSAAWYLLGEIHRAQQPEQARKEYAEAIAGDPQFVNPYIGLMLIAVDQKNWEEAQRASDQVIRLNGPAVAYFYNSAANYSLKKLEIAEQSARKFISIDLDHHKPEICLILASILQAKHDSAGAAQQLRTYLALVPNTPIADQLRADAQRLENTPSGPR